ncbi:hypothetical protein CIT31_32480 [Mesorhizobium wenxiniae]|uniref:Uncharacterized protein n=1 Tax=Mesorhizobium wenxiniae TaxID=2014805 RepID=A0A271K788_9HYPH|nr:hypothetical protein CIT31_32480 [Mesorhizobium wenxiniae]
MNPPDSERLNPPDVGRPSAEMLLTLPKFIVGELMFGAPVPITYYVEEDGELKLNAASIKVEP